MFEDHLKDIGTVNKSEDDNDSDESPQVQEYSESDLSEPQKESDEEQIFPKINNFNEKLE